MLKSNFNSHKYIIVLILSSAIFALNTLVKAASGDLDMTFNGNGKLTLDFGGNEIGQKVAVQTDGKIVVSGYSKNYLNSPLGDFLLARLNENGTLDQTFGIGGKVVTDFGGWYENLGMTIQSDGKIILVGAKVLGGSLIARYNSDGSLDKTFGNGNGFLLNNFGTESRFNDVVVQPDGKIVAVGVTRTGINSDSNMRFLAVRFNANGSFDPSFGSNGVIYVGETTVGLYQIANSVVLQSDGKIIIGGDVANVGGWIRVNSNGSPENGTSLQLQQTSIFIHGIAVQSDGKILLSGDNYINNVRWAVTRYNSDKSLDTSFGNNGIATAGFEKGGIAFGGMALQPSGKIIVGASVIGIGLNNLEFGLARFSASGLLDESFGVNGKVITSFGNDRDELWGLNLQSDGKIIAVGKTHNGNSDDFAVARYSGDNPANTPQNTPFDFDGDGKADVSVFRDGNWYILQSADNSFKAVSFGQIGDLIVPADFDGDGKTDPAVFRPTDANWYYLRSSDGGFVAQQFGTSDSLPRPSDFDGDSKADIAVFHSPTGNWYIKQSQTNTTRIVNFGTNGDFPLIADFDGDRKSDVAVFRQNTGNWFWLNSSNGGFNAAQFGANGDLPISADFDDDGKTDFAVFRPSSGTWYQMRSTNGFSAVNFGISTDKIVAADYNGDGKTDIGVFRNGNWYQLQSNTNNFVSASWGQANDIAVPAAFLP